MKNTLKILKEQYIFSQFSIFFFIFEIQNV